MATAQRVGVARGIDDTAFFRLTGLSFFIAALVEILFQFRQIATMGSEVRNVMQKEKN